MQNYCITGKSLHLECAKWPHAELTIFYHRILKVLYKCFSLQYSRASESDLTPCNVLHFLDDFCLLL